MTPAALLAAAHPIVHVNATLNGLATVLLLIGFALIKQGREKAHKQTMLGAFAVSTVFLICYLWYHFQEGSVEFTASGSIRYVYYSILLSHVVLAFTVPFLAIATIYLGHKALGCGGRGAGGDPTPELDLKYRTRHRALARWTFPIWLYVSVTGVVVYAMLYHLWPSDTL